MFAILLLLTLTLWLLVIYHHLIYPFLLLKFSNTVALPDKKVKYISLNDLPAISILMPTYNEEQYIADKIRNLACLDYAKDKLSIWIVCDGCSDATEQIARQCIAEPEIQHLNICLISLTKNIGKTAILNRFIPQLSGEIIALTDTSALLSLDALLIAARCFKNPQTGIVAASYQLWAPGSAGERAYWRYQSRIKQAEASTGNPIGVHGALYFFRAQNFIALPADSINDDFILPMAMIERGKSAIYCSAIIALELEQSNSGIDHKRRTRIAEGNLQQLIYCRKLLNPIFKGTAVNFFSGKVLRALMPLILFTQMFLCLTLALFSPFFITVSVLQVVAVSLAWLSLKFDPSPIPNLFKMLFYLINGYRYGLLGSWHFLRTHRSEHWH
ncbi:MAG: hypothetical protein OFPI_42020 [Osedax symbiont Rs2]|nr:MAG: hypothetical protein OFPI_42020 [Osedax symbiont Rs2]